MTCAYCCVFSECVNSQLYAYGLLLNMLKELVSVMILVFLSCLSQCL